MAFQSDGIEALKPHQKGRLPKVHKKNTVQSTGVIYLRKMKSIVLKKNRELHEIKLELEITKNL